MGIGRGRPKFGLRLLQAVSMHDFIEWQSRTYLTHGLSPGLLSLRNSQRSKPGKSSADVHVRQFSKALKNTHTETFPFERCRPRPISPKAKYVVKHPLEPYDLLLLIFVRFEFWIFELP